MAVAQIPDLKNWEVSANVGELDRGHLAIGQKVTVTVVALPGKEFAGHVKNIGGTTGPPWDRRFESRIALDEPAPELRPGMTSNMVITVETLDNVIWIPSQALFESDGRTFVYARGPSGFIPHDVTLVKPQREPGRRHRHQGRRCRRHVQPRAAAQSRLPARYRRRHEGPRAMILLSDLTQAVRQSARAENPHPAHRPRHRLRRRLASSACSPSAPAPARNPCASSNSLGVRNVLVESRPTTSQEEFQQRRRSSPGLSDTRRPHPQRQYRIPRDALRPPHHPSRARPPQTLPRHPRALRRRRPPTPSSTASTSPRASSSTRPTTLPAPTSASSAKAPRSTSSAMAPPSASSSRSTIPGWKSSASSTSSSWPAPPIHGGTMQDVNNIIYIPLNTFQYRFWDPAQLHERRSRRHRPPPPPRRR